jgi:cytochrome c5
MKSTLIMALMVLTVYSCAKKTVPVAATTPTEVKTTPEIKAPDAAKIDAATNTETAIITAGHATFDAKCGRCHGLKDPGNYTAERWVGILKIMAPRARLDETENANVLAYVQFYAKKS